jgi:hypothetical protein
MYEYSLLSDIMDGVYIYYNLFLIPYYESSITWYEV